MDDPLEKLEHDLHSISEEIEEPGVDRRAFVFLSLAAAAATTLGVRGAEAQRGAGAAQGGTQPLSPVPLEEPPSFVSVIPRRDRRTPSENTQGARCRCLRSRTVCRPTMDRPVAGR
jgi:hypothetical protein